MRTSVDGLIFNGMTQADGSTALGLARPAGAHRIASDFRAKGLNIEVVDFSNYWSLDELKTLIKSRCDSETLFIGWSLTFLRPAKEISEVLLPWIRTTFPNIKILVGGTSTLY